MKTGEKVGKWFSAHLWKTDFKVIGASQEDVRGAYQKAVEDKVIVNRRLGFPLDENAGFTTNETSLRALKRKEIVHKLSTVIPAVAGLAFLSEAFAILRESGAHGPEAAIGGLMGVIGLAAITFGQYITWETGDIYGRMHDWVKSNDVKNPVLGIQHWPESRE